MDINTNVSQHQAAVVTPLKSSNGHLPADKAVHSEHASLAKEELRLAPVSAQAEAKTHDGQHSADLEQAVDKLNGYLQNVQRNLQFSIDNDSGAMVVKVIDSNSQKVIRQMPSEESLRLARHLAEDKQAATLNIFSSRA